MFALYVYYVLSQWHVERDMLPHSRSRRRAGRAHEHSAPVSVCCLRAPKHRKQCHCPMRNLRRELWLQHRWLVLLLLLQTSTHVEALGYDPTTSPMLGRTVASSLELTSSSCERGALPSELWPGCLSS
jgi:hypothetical protein